MGFMNHFQKRYTETQESIQGAKESLHDTKEFIKDPVGSTTDAAKEAGASWIDGVIDQAASRFCDWFTQTIDSMALGGMMVGCFLYMLGIKKGGQASWLILAVWFTARVLLWSGGIPSP